MQVFRKEKGIIDFDTFEEGELIYCRDRSWIRPPVDIQNKAVWRRFTKQIKDLEESQEKGRIIFAEHTWKHEINALVSDDPEKVMINRFFDSEIYIKKVKDYLEYIHIPGTKDLYIVCSAYWLSERNEKSSWHKENPYAVIPENGMELNIPVFACRRSADGKFGSITPEDTPILCRYMRCTEMH